MISIYLYIYRLKILTHPSFVGLQTETARLSKPLFLRVCVCVFLSFSLCLSVCFSLSVCVCVWEW